MPEHSFRVDGQVSDTSSRPLKDLIVRVFDRDLRREQLLGGAVTNDRGRYEIAYSDADFSRAEKDAADLVVRVYTTQGVLVGSSVTVFNAGEREHIDLVVRLPEDPRLSEYERLLATLAPVLDDGVTIVTPAQLTEEDIAFLLGEFAGDPQLDERRLTILAQAARLAEQTSLPTEVFYGVARIRTDVEEPLVLAMFLAPPLAATRRAIAQAIDEDVVPARLRDSLDDLVARLEELRVEHGFVVRHQVTGRLVETHSGAPLIGYTVRAVDRDGDDGPHDLGVVMTNSRGLFVLAFAAPPVMTPEAEAPPQRRRLLLEILNPDDGERVHGEEVVVPQPQREVIEIRIDAPASVDPATTPLADTVPGVSAPLLAFLAGRDIRNLRDVRRAGGLGRLAGLPVPADDPKLSALDAHAHLNLLSPDVAQNQMLVDAGFPTIVSIARRTRADFIGAVRDTLGAVTAAQLHTAARAQMKLLNTIFLGLQADWANGSQNQLLDHFTHFQGHSALPDQPAAAGGGGVHSWFTPKCSCEDCEAAVSPLAYLADLLDYTLRNLTLEGSQPIGLAWLTSTFHQPFGDLPASCQSAEERVRQVRLCVEVLRRYLKANGLPVGGQATDLKLAEASYRLEAYTALLLKIGTSYEEIRLARHADQETRRELSDRLGLDSHATQPDALSMLFLVPSPLPVAYDVLDEAMLERLFGLLDTRRDPLSTGLKSADADEQIRRWALDGVAWNRNTDADGTVYVRLSHPSAAEYKVEIFRDAARTAPDLVAAGTTTAPVGRIDVAAQNGSGLSGRFEIDYTSGSNAIEIAVVPLFLTRRLAHLRTVWQEQDRPVDVYADGATEQQPLIDPDVIGPDDFRTPVSANAAFTIWKDRRELEDSVLAVLKSAHATTGDWNAVLAHIWVPGPGEPSLNDTFAALRAQLTGGSAQEAAAASTTVASVFRLTVESFMRLMDIKAKYDQLQPSQKPTADEWAEVFDILLQVEKAKNRQGWIQEEKAHAIVLGPKDFCPSLREPGEGAWPPHLVAGEPLIDPEVVAIRDLPDDLPAPAVGAAALEFWRFRQKQLDGVREGLRQAREAQGFDAMVRLAIGHPSPGDALQHDLDQLALELESPLPATAQSAETTIAADFRLSTKQFQRVMAIRAKATQPDPLTQPTAEEWQEIDAVLTTASKEKHYYEGWNAYQGWVAEEQAAGLVHWNALKATLPRWRAPAATRQAWQQALRTRSAAPIIDPDVIGPAHLRNPAAGDAHALWAQRYVWINDPVDGQLAKLKAVRLAAPTLLAGFDLIVEQTLGTDAEYLTDIARRRQEGEDIRARLERLNLSREGFEHLLRVRTLLTQSPALPLLESEWTDVESILAGVSKRREFAGWRAGEGATAIVHGPDQFKLPASPALQFPPPEPEAPPAWRASRRDRRNWEDALDSRIDQERTTIEALRTIVSEVEEDTLPLLRDALIEATGAGGEELSAKAKWVTDRLLIDAAAGGCQMTTRVSQAIETLQGLLWSERTGQLEDSHPQLTLEQAQHFDEEWRWLGSYETWRAAMFVFLYPENILLPTLRTGQSQTPAFRQLVAALRGARELSPEETREAAARYVEYFRDVVTMRVEAAVQSDIRVIFFGRGESGIVYASFYDSPGGEPFSHTFWQPVDILESIEVIEIVGAAVYRDVAAKRHVYVFLRTRDKAVEKLTFIRYDLEADRWTGEPSDLELPDEATVFSGVVKQRNRQDEPPHVAIRLASGAIFGRKLDVSGSDWAEGAEAFDGWDYLVGWPRGQTFSRLCAMIETNAPGDDFALFVENKSGGVSYRIFGSKDDGAWRELGSGAWVGGVKLPAADDLFVFWNPAGHAGLTAYQVLRPGTTKPELWSVGSKTFADFDQWLQERAGMTLASWTIQDDTLYSGITLLQFFQLSLQEGNKSASPFVPSALHHLSWSPFASLASATIKELREFYKARAQVYIDALASKAEEGDDRELALVDSLVRRFCAGGSLRKVLQQLLRFKLLQTVVAVEKGDDIYQTTADDYFTLTARNDAGEQSAVRTAPMLERLERLEHASGPPPQVPWAFSGYIAYRRAAGQQGSPRSVLRRSVLKRQLGDHLAEVSPTLLAPDVTEPFDITDRLTSDERQQRRSFTAATFKNNGAGPRSNVVYLEEAFCFVPIQLALQLQAHGHYTAALDWFRTVYDYTAPQGHRKIYYGLEQEASLQSGYERKHDWLLDPLNPHAIAATRQNAYTRFTLSSLVRCLLDYADAEFTRDTAESIPRARTLYLTALELLQQSELAQWLNGCQTKIKQIDITIPAGAQDAYMIPENQLVYEITHELLKIGDSTALEKVGHAVVDALADGDAWHVRYAKAIALIDEARAAQRHATPTLGAVVSGKPDAIAGAQTVLLSHDAVSDAVTAVGNMTMTRVRQRVVTAVGHHGLAPAHDLIELSWMSSPTALPDAGGGAPFLADVMSPSRGDPGGGFDVGWNVLADAFGQGIDDSFTFGPFYEFCVPPNPIPDGLRLHAELNLYKLRTCRNIAGLTRHVEPYAAATDSVSGLPYIGAAGQLVLPGTATLQPTPYRYAVLMERAKQLVQLAAQIEGGMLAALEKRDAEAFQLLKARQDIQLTRAGVQLQVLRVREAESGVELAELQRDRAEIQVDYYDNLIGDGPTALELAALALLGQSLFVPDSVTSGPNGGISWSPSGKLQTAAGILTTLASWERRSEDWKFQKALAEQDVRIGAQQVRLAKDHVRIVQSDYWNAPMDGLASEGEAPDRRGLTGSARLLQDIYRLDQHAFESERRKLQLTKTVSLAGLDPYAFQRFRETGVMSFRTPMELFDREFPGHHLRLIHRVRTSIIALIPPTDGIRATLSTTGLSRVVITGNGLFQTASVNRPPQSVALTSPSNAIGLFELTPQPGDMLLPFEGLGVDTEWELRMPKAANQFDYRSIADVLLAIEYTAIDSADYRHQLLQQMDGDFSAARPFSFRHQFADAWYDLHNPEQTATPMVVRFRTRREDFPPNLDYVKIQQIALYFARANGSAFEMPVKHLLFTEHGAAGPVGGGATTIDGTISTRKGNAGTWMSILGKSPVGEWELALPTQEALKFTEEQVEDILLLVTYKGETPAWPV